MVVHTNLQKQSQQRIAVRQGQTQKHLLEKARRCLAVLQVPELGLHSRVKPDDESPAEGTQRRFFVDLAQLECAVTAKLMVAAIDSNVDRFIQAYSAVFVCVQVAVKARNGSSSLQVCSAGRLLLGLEALLRPGIEVRGG